MEEREEQEKNELGYAPVGSLLFRLALPAVIAQVVNMLYNMVDRIYIGHIPETGATALTGVGVGMPLIMLISAFAALAGMGGAPKATILLGKNDKEGAEKVLGNCVTLMILLSIALTIFFLIFGRKLLLIFGASSETIGYAWDYFKIYAFGTIFVQITLSFNCFITAQGFSKISMLTVLIGAVCNIVLDPVFIFGFGMGVKGAALATIISQAISAIWVLRFLMGPKTGLRIRRENCRPKKEILLPCIALGLSPFVMNATESLISICFNMSLQKYSGDTAVGAITILSTVMQITTLPMVGLTQGAQPIISYNYGAKQIDRVKKTFRMLLVTCVIFSTAIWGLAMIAPHIFVGMFTSDASLVAYAQKALRVFMAASFLMGVQISCQQTFIALDKAGVSLFLALLRKVFLLIPLIYFLPNVIQDAAFGVFLAEPIADGIAVSVTAVLFFIIFKKAMESLKETS